MTLYDQLEYPGHAVRETHPDHVGGLALLHGLDPPGVRTCRVLELGCGDGANLVPMAYSLPEATFVGIDLAAGAIRRGTRMIEALGLGNVRLVALDLMSPLDEFGTFDYIVAHGLYSWVPGPVRERVLAVCAMLLAPQGIAFISHLALPGTHLRNVLRDVMRHHDDASASPAERVARAREVAGWLHAAGTGTDACRAAVRSLAHELDDVADGALFHDYLAEDNEAVYIAEFAGRAAKHGLQFLCDAEFASTRWEHDPTLQPVRQQIEAAGEDSVLEREQLMDVVRCRRFRQTLLCRAGLQLEAPAPHHLRRTAISSTLSPSGTAVDLASRKVATFRSPAGVSLQIDHPAAKAALVALSERWPGALAWPDLMDVVAQKCGFITGAGHVVENVLFACVTADFAAVHALPPRMANRAGERPRASGVARFEVERQRIVTTLRHGNLRIDDPDGVRLLSLLDGTRDRDQLVDLMAEADPAAVAKSPGRRERRRSGDLRKETVRRLEAALDGLARAGLLEI